MRNRQFFEEHGKEFLRFLNFFFILCRFNSRSSLERELIPTWIERPFNMLLRLCLLFCGESVLLANELESDTDDSDDSDFLPTNQSESDSDSLSEVE